MSDDFEPAFAPWWGDLESLCKPVSPPIETGAGSVPARSHDEAVAALREVTASFELLTRLLRDAPRQDAKFNEVDEMAGAALRTAQVALARFRQERDSGEAPDLVAFSCPWLPAMEA